MQPNAVGVEPVTWSALPDALFPPARALVPTWIIAKDVAFAQDCAR